VIICDFTIASVTDPMLLKVKETSRHHETQVSTHYPPRFRLPCSEAQQRFLVRWNEMRYSG